jgi:DNA-binding transcriptional MerR regulator
LSLVDTYKLDELAREADVPPRTVRYYVQRGLLPPPDFRGSQTTYGPGHLLRLKVVKKLQREHLPLEVIASRLAGASLDELERMLALADDATVVVSHRAPEPFAAVRRTATSWERIELLPGLELHVRADAPALARRLAPEITSHYGARAPEKE